MLNRLKIYSENNQLEVNINKTKITIFREAGRPPDYAFYYNEIKIEIVKNISYLGSTF